jgi:hypothetical protein
MTVTQELPEILARSSVSQASCLTGIELGRAEGARGRIKLEV